MGAIIRLYSAGSAVEAHDLRLVLAAHGIEATVFGGSNALEAGISFTPQSAPRVYVNEADNEAAASVLKQFLTHTFPTQVDGTWACPNCKESVEAQFDVCWNCLSPKWKSPLHKVLLTPSAEDKKENEHELDSAYIAADLPHSDAVIVSPPHATWRLWVEVLIVLALTSPLFGGFAVGTMIIRAIGFPDTTSTFYLPTLIAYAFEVVIVLMAIRLSGESWSAFGITKLTLVDVITAGLVCFADYVITIPGNDIFRDLLRSIYGAPYVDRLIQAHRLVLHAHGFTGLVALLTLAISVALKEELIARGYLIPRLERLLGGTFVSVLVSATLFALFHWHRGAILTWNAFLIGLVYGTAFVWTRRLWPVVIAHALVDFAVFLHFASIASN